MPTQAMCAFCIPEASAGRLRCAVLKIPAKSSIPRGLPLNKKRSLRTHSESTLPQLLIPLHFKSRISNTYRKQGEGAPCPSPKLLQLVTPHVGPSLCLFTSLPRYVIASHSRFCTRRNPRNPNPFYALLHNSCTPRGWGPLTVVQPSLAAAFRITGHGSRNTGHRPRPYRSRRTVAPQPAKCQNRRC